MATLMVVIEDGFTPRDFLSKRYRVYIRRGPEAKDVTWDKNYGDGKSEALSGARSWAKILDCPMEDRSKS